MDDCNASCVTGHLGVFRSPPYDFQLFFSLWVGEACVPYFIICIPGCIDLEGQFGGGRKEGREGNSETGVLV